MRRLALLLLTGAASAAQAQTSVPTRALVDEARAAQARGEPAAALASLEHAAALEPDNAEVLRLLGVAQGQAGRTDEALRTLARAQAIAPTDSDIKLATAQVHYYRGDSDRALQMAQEVAAAAPGNADARDLLDRARRAVRERGPGTRLDVYGGYSDFNQRARKPWLEMGAALSHRVDERWQALARADVADRFGKTDVFLEGGFERRIGGSSALSLSAGGTPNADFLPEWSLRGSYRTQAWQGSDRNGAGAGILLLDARYAEYRSGSVETLSPGLEQYLAGGRLWATGRLIFTWDENGNRQTGWLVRGDGYATDRLRLFAGYADAPETSENVTLTTRTIFGGVIYDLDDNRTLRFDYARDDRERSYVRHAFTVGVGLRF